MIGVRSSKDPRSVIQDGWWGLKLILIIGFIIMAFFIPTPFYEGWAWISLFGSAIFILAQLVLLIDFAHSWTESWAEYYNKMEQKIWLWLLIICTGILFIGGLVLTILTYVFFVKGENCQMNIAFPTINIFFAVLYTIVSVHPTIQEANHGRSGLLQASVVFVYTSYLVWSSINSEPLTWKCNGISSGSSTVAIVIGAVFAILAVCYSAFTTSGSTASIVGTSEDKEDSSQGEPLVNKIDEKKEEEPTTADIDDEKETTSYNYTLYHLVFAFGAMYVGMLLTSWAMIDESNDTSPVVDNGLVSFLVKLISSYLTIALYSWTVVAPYLFPNRDWS